MSEAKFTLTSPIQRNHKAMFRYEDLDRLLTEFLAAWDPHGQDKPKEHVLRQLRLRASIKRYRGRNWLITTTTAPNVHVSLGTALNVLDRLPAAKRAAKLKELMSQHSTLKPALQPV